MSQPKVSPKPRRTSPAATKKAPKPDPEVVFSSSGLEDEFRRLLDPNETLEWVHIFYQEWLEEVEALIEEFGPETTVAEIRKKMD